MKIACLFGGYSSQFVGMGKQIYDESRLMQEYFEQASYCLKKNFIKLCFASSDTELKKIENAYTSLFLVNTALYAVLSEQGISFDMVCGYNDGEYSALFAAGSITLPDGLYLLHKYSLMYNDFIKNKDVQFIHVVGVGIKQLQKICLGADTYGGCLQIIMYDGVKNHTVVGDTKGVDFLRSLFKENETVSLEVVSFGIGLHCAQLDDAVVSYKMYLQKVDFKDARIPIVSAATDSIIKRGGDLQEAFLSHLKKPLVFTRVLKRLSEYDVIVVPCKADELIGYIQDLYPKKLVIAIQTMRDIESLQKLFHKRSLHG